MNELDSIGFYTLTDDRARTASASSVLMRAEVLITDKCNFRCPYCRGVPASVKGEQDISYIHSLLKLLQGEGVRNIRFTGGEPTCHAYLQNIVQNCSMHFANHIALSTNGSADLQYYEMLLSHGVNDFSISLDGGCCAVGDAMTGGVTGVWHKVVKNIRHLATETYVTIGMVFTEMNTHTAKDSVLFADSLGVSDIRIIPSAQYNQSLDLLRDLPDSILNKYPILKYRVNNIRKGRTLRGLSKGDTHRCPLVLDDVMLAGKYHFPCPIYMREQGKPIGEVSGSLRAEREHWFNKTDTHDDAICKANCLDVCIDYNNRWEFFHDERI